MTCLEQEERISRYIDNELNERGAGLMFAHLAACSRCRSFMSELLWLRAELMNDKERQSSLLAMQDAETQRPVSVPSTAPVPRAGWRSRRVSLSLPIAAVIAILLALTSALLTRASVETPPPKEVILISLPTVEVQGYRLETTSGVRQ
jgi:anti-sigma factor RsiW